jgi:hypothetical protein
MHDLTDPESFPTQPNGLGDALVFDVAVKRTFANVQHCGNFFGGHINL